MPRRQIDDIIIVDEMIDAINQYMKDNNISMFAFSLKVGFGNDSINRWVNGKSKSISRDKWNAIYPFIKTYLPEGKYGYIEKKIKVGGHYVKQVGNGNSAVIESNVIQAKIKEVMKDESFTSEEKLKIIDLLMR